MKPVNKASAREAVALSLMVTAATLPTESLPPLTFLLEWYCIPVLSTFDGTCNHHKTFCRDFLHFLSKGADWSQEHSMMSRSLSETVSWPHCPVTMAVHLCF